jgi:uncharacterized membrane protein
MKFTIADLMYATLAASIGVWFLVFLSRNFLVPVPVSLAAACVIPGAVIGMLVAGQFKGGAVGAIIGAVLGLISLAVYVACARLGICVLI